MFRELVLHTLNGTINVAIAYGKSIAYRFVSTRSCVSFHIIVDYLHFPYLGLWIRVQGLGLGFRVGYLSICLQEKDFGEALQGTQIQSKLVPNSLPKHFENHVSWLW